MRIGIIDLGTNSVRFDVQEFSTKTKQTSSKSHKSSKAAKTTKKLYSERIMIRLGHAFFEKGEMDPKAIDRATQALLHFKEVGDSFSVSRYFAFATATLRESPEGKEIAKTLQNITGIPIRIISGSEEARLIAKGILKNEKLPKGRFGILDIGGGSSEVIYCHGKNAIQWHSFPLGTARLQQIFLKKTPAKPEDIKQLRQHVQQEIKRYQKKKEWPKLTTFLGSSGTLKTLVKIHKELFSGKGFETKNMPALLKLMEGATTMELLEIPGMESKRIDMILAGTLLADEILKAFGAKKLSYTEHALRDGILEEERALLTHNTKNLHVESFESIHKKLLKLGYNTSQLEHVHDLTRKLYTGTTPLHRMEDKDCFLLEASALLRRIGHVISPFQYAEHSHYFITHSEFSGLDPTQIQKISELCRHIPLKKIDLRLKKDPKFEKSLALLKLIDALDFRFESRIQIRQITYTRKELHIYLRGGSGSGIELSRIEQRKGYFEKTFKTKLLVTLSKP